MKWPGLKVYFENILMQIKWAPLVNSCLLLLFKSLIVLFVLWIAKKVFDVTLQSIVRVMRKELVEFSKGNWNTATINAGGILLVAIIISLSVLSEPFKDFFISLGVTEVTPKAATESVGAFGQSFFLGLLVLGSTFIVRGKL